MKELSQKVIEDYLSSGAAKIGDKLPAIPLMAQRYQVSPPTMGKALGILQVQGYLKGRRGSGVFVTRLPSEMFSGNATPNRFSIGLLSSSIHLANPILQGIVRATNRMQLNLQLASAEWDYSEERCNLVNMIEGGADGVLLLPVLSPRDDAGDYLLHEFPDFPIVQFDTPVPGANRSRIVFDNWSAGYEMTKFLIEQGHRHIAFMHLRTPTPNRSVEDRLAGFLRAMEEAGICRSDYFVQKYFSPARPISEKGADSSWGVYDRILERNRGEIPKLLSHSPKPTAIIAPSDRYAHALQRLLHEAGIFCPQDIVVVGFDNSQEPEWSEFFFTTKPDFGQMGERAVQMLVEQIEKKESTVTELVLPCPLYLPPELPLSQLSLPLNKD